MTEDDLAYSAFLQWRWPETEGKPICPACDHGRIYNISTRRRFKCAGCYTQFSATTGTVFASRKMTFANIIEVLNLLGKVPALELSRRIGSQYKTAFVLAHKLRGNPSEWVGYWQR